MESQLKDAELFIQSEDSKVVLEVPGCHALCINAAHNLEFPVQNLRIAKNPTEYLSFKTAKPTETLCYCEKVNALFSLRGEFCVFESARVALLKSGNQPKVHSNLGYLKLTEANGYRRYRIYRVDSKLVGNGDPKDLLMQSRLMPLGGLEVCVEIRRRSGDEFPNDLSVVVGATKTVFIPLQNYLVPRDIGYEKFDILLWKCREMLAKEIPQNKVESYARGHLKEFAETEVCYEPIDGYLAWLFSEFHNQQLIQRIEKDRERLFDPLVVTRSVETKIREMLTSDLPGESWAKLGKEAKLQIVRAQLSGNELDKQVPFSSPQNDLQEQVIPEVEAEFGEFLEKFPELIKRKRGRFVAIRGGKVLAEESSEEKLVKGLFDSDVRGFVLIQQVPEALGLS